MSDRRSPSRRVLVLGASGVVGRAAVERFLEDPAADVVAVSRRPPEVAERAGYRHLPLDLRDGAAVAAGLREAGPITHVVYAALHEQASLIAGWVEREQIETNARMFANVLDALEASGSPVVHVAALQGTKAYGYHLGPMRIPGKESQPRVGHGNFYWEQEDRLVAAAATNGFSYTIFRPQFIFGGVTGAAMSLIPVIGIYAALCRELGIPFTFPGGAPYVAEAVDSRLLARALDWAFGAPAARDQTFNITNGDVFAWRDLWPSFARMLEVEPGPDEPRSLAAWLPAQEAAWAAVVRKHGLRGGTLAGLLGLSHQYADDAFAWTPDGAPLESRSRPVLLSTVKLRQAGFGDCIDTEAMFEHWFGRLRRERLLP